jgi:hypothetical protein
MRKLLTILAIALLIGCEKEEIKPIVEPCCYQIINHIYSPNHCDGVFVFMVLDTCLYRTDITDCLQEERYNLPFAKDSMEANPNYMIGTFLCEI